MSTLPPSCPHCASQNFVQTAEPLTSIHYARLTCGDCGAWLRWLAKPKTEDTPISVIKLLRSNDLTDRERSFLKALAHRAPTKAELIMIRAIVARINPSNNSESHTENNVQLSLEFN